MCEAARSLGTNADHDGTAWRVSRKRASLATSREDRCERDLFEGEVLEQLHGQFLERPDEDSPSVTIGRAFESVGGCLDGVEQIRDSAMVRLEPVDHRVEIRRCPAHGRKQRRVLVAVVGVDKSTVSQAIDSQQEQGDLASAVHESSPVPQLRPRPWQHPLQARGTLASRDE